MKIVVCGCGKIGKTVIASLIKEKHNVLAVDINPSVVEEMRNSFDIIAITGNGTEYQTLKDAGADKAELFISVTESDELNMLACFAAKRMGAKHTVARIRELENNAESLNFMKQQLQLSLAVNPERMTAEAIFNLIKLPSATNVEVFPGNKLSVIEFQLRQDSPLNNLSLIDFRRRSDIDALVCAVERDGKIYIPNGSFVLKANDKISVIAKKRDTLKIAKATGLAHKQIRNIMILGASTIAVYLSQMLLAVRHSVKLIDSDPKVCDDVCETLPDSATVIKGNGMSQELLIEEGILNTDAFVTLTGKDEINVLMSLFATSQNVPKVITKVKHKEISTLAENLGLDSLISPRRIAADLIVKYARAVENTIGSQIETLYTLMNGQVEVTEFKVLPNFEYASLPLTEMKLHENVLIAGISRGRDAFIPGGQDSILPGDKVIIVASDRRILTLSDIVAR